MNKGYRSFSWICLGLISFLVWLAYSPMLLGEISFFDGLRLFVFCFFIAFVWTAVSVAVLILNHIKKKKVAWIVVLVAEIVFMLIIKFTLF